VLKEVQMTPSLFFGVIGFAGLPALRAWKGMPSFEIQEEVQPLGSRIELRVIHKPGPGQAQRQLKKGLFVHPLILYYPLKTSKNQKKDADAFSYPSVRFDTAQMVPPFPRE